ncbi:MAG TPA: hypothetical protein VGM92_06975, partial [Candidatus Kapabacteria bacterium]
FREIVPFLRGQEDFRSIEWRSDTHNDYRDFVVLQFDNFEEHGDGTGMFFGKIKDEKIGLELAICEAFEAYLTSLTNETTN